MTNLFDNVEMLVEEAERNCDLDELKELFDHLANKATPEEVGDWVDSMLEAYNVMDTEITPADLQTMIYHYKLKFNL